MTSPAPPKETVAPTDPALTSDDIALASTHGSARLELPPLRLWLLILGISVGLFLSFLDSSIVATSLFTIGTEFGNLELVNWIALSYTLTYLSCAVLVASISDVVGRRNAYMASYVVFIAFSIGCGFAQNMSQLIACRALQGLGGSGLYSLTMIVMPEVAPVRIQHMIGGLIGLIITIASVLGPVLGGILTHYASWRWVFWINGPIGLVSMCLLFLMWPKPQYMPYHQSKSWSEVDYFGSGLLIAAAVLVVFPFQNAAEESKEWSRPIFLAPLIIGILCWLALPVWSAFVERRWGHRMTAALPMRLLRNRVYACAAVNTMLLGFPYVMITYAFPLRLQVVNGKSALIAGVMLLPMLGSSALGSTLSGAVNSKQNRTSETLVLASCSMIIGCGLLTTVSGSYSLQAKALGFLVFVGLGFGLSVSTTTMLAVLQSSARDHATAQGFIAQLRVLGGSIGIAASSAILGVTLQGELGGSVSPQQLSAMGKGGSGITRAQLQAVRHIYSDAFKEDTQVCTIVTGVGILFALGTFTKHRVTMQQHRERQAKEEREMRLNDAQRQATNSGIL